MWEDDDMVRAIQRNNFSVVRKLIEEGWDVNAKLNCFSKALSTYLHHAVYENRPAILKLLLDSGANPNVRNSFGQNPLNLAGKLYLDRRPRFTEEEYMILFNMLVDADCEVFADYRSPYRHLKECFIEFGRHIAYLHWVALDPRNWFVLSKALLEFQYRYTLQPRFHRFIRAPERSSNLLEMIKTLKHGGI